MEYKGRILVLLLLAAAVPATAQSFGFTIGTSAPPACLSIGNAIWRVGGEAGPAAITVRIDPSAQAPDIRVGMAETPDEADFVFVDDGETSASCPAGPARLRNVKIDPKAARPDLTLGFASAAAPADYRIYVRSRSLAPETAAAMFAAARMPARALGSRATAAR